MNVTGNRAKVALFAITIAATASVALGNPSDYKPSPAEAALLPHFCWHQMFGSKFSGPEFTINGCGVGMNHYCYGLVALNRANRMIGNQGRQRLDYLHIAKSNTLYTLRWMKRYPRCPIRAHVETTLRIINNQLKVIR